MKKYLEFKVEIPELETGNDYVKDIIAKANTETKEAELTDEINTQTTKVLKNILQDTVNDINEILEPLNVQFLDGISKINCGSNKVNGWVATLPVGIYNHKLSIIPISAKVEGTRYTTYPGGYRFEYFNRKIELGDFMDRIKTSLIINHKEQI